MSNLAEQSAFGFGIARAEFPHPDVEQVIEEKRAVPGAVRGRHLRIKPAPLLGFLAGHNCSTDGLSVFEDLGLDGFVFPGCGHKFVLTPGLLECETHLFEES